jgi:mannose-1-phosphate guanylyltransferase / mannose-6-phosphate isomerase
MVAADYHIPDTEEFAAAARAAPPAAAAGAIMTFGVKPTYPASRYGYIRAPPEEAGSPVRKVGASVEKPDAATAARYVANGYSGTAAASRSVPR